MPKRRKGVRVRPKDIERAVMTVEKKKEKFSHCKDPATAADAKRKINISGVVLAISFVGFLAGLLVKIYARRILELLNLSTGYSEYVEIIGNVITLISGISLGYQILKHFLARREYKKACSTEVQK